MHGDRTIRGTVKPYWRKAQGLWFARGWVPERQPDGRITRRRIERGPGSASRSACQGLCDQINALYEGRAAAVRKPLSFARAVTNYVTKGGEARFLTDALMARIGPRQCSDIDDSLMTDLTNDLFPNASPATINRQLYTPIVAVLTLAARGGHCPKPAITRPKGHDTLPPIRIPPDEWFDKMQAECSPRLWALMLVLTLHGRRIKELIELVPADYNRKRKTLSIPDSKTGDPILVRLAPVCVKAINAMTHEHSQLFGYTYKSRRNVLRDIKAAAKRAGVDYFGTHALGRHSFATRFLNEGFSVKHTMAAGGWASEKMVMQRYGHLEKSEVADAVVRVGMKWGSTRARKRASNVIHADFTGKKPSGKKGSGRQRQSLVRERS